MADFLPRHISAGAGVTLVHNGPGVVTGLLISHGDPLAQTVILYNGTSAADPVLSKIVVHADQAPVYLKFTMVEALRFTVGLAVDPAACEVSVFGAGNR